MVAQHTYPRPLFIREREWLEWILPAERTGYRPYRDFIASAVVLGEGRRGSGEFILGAAGDAADLSGPLPAVIAYGVIETDFGNFSVTVRDIVDRQCSVEIVSNRSDAIPGEFEEARRWTYSTWSPGDPCPQCLAPAREVPMGRAGEVLPPFVLAFCTADRRVWIYERASGMIRLIPVTNFYNELMFRKHIRDPKVALDSKRLFTDLPKYSDADLRAAFESYNSLMTKIHIAGALSDEKPHRSSWLQRFRNFLGRR